MTETGPRVQQLASRTHVCSGSQCWVLRAHNAQPGLLQLIMCGVQNCLPSVHLLFSLMPNLITYPWFHRQRNFLVCFFGSMPNSVTRWHPLLFPSILQSTAPGSRLHTGFKSENDVLYFSVLRPSFWHTWIGLIEVTRIPVDGCGL